MSSTLSRNLLLEHKLVPWWDNTVEKKQRLTKIVCTIGPNTNKVEVLSEMMKTGMNIARMNFSHGDHEYHKNVLENVRKATKVTGIRCALMLDTKGPEIRTGKIKGGSINLKAGDKITVTNDNTIEGTEKMISLDYHRFPSAVKPHGTILIADGNLGLTIQTIDAKNGKVECVINNNFVLGNTKNCHLPGAVIDLPAVSEKDKKDLKFGVENHVDYVAASFIRTANDVREIRQLLGKEGDNIKIISKIESTEGLENFSDILDASDGIMVARGDLGVELPMEQIFAAQKMMISKCNARAKPVITATQMLESMIENPRPTRAEATDVANAVLDGTDAVMLSGETASGKYPIQAISYMAKLCISAERVEGASHYPGLFEALKSTNPATQVSEVVSSYAVRAANDLKASLIITITETGNTAKEVAKYRPRVPVVAITPTEDSAFGLCASRSIIPLVVAEMDVTEKLVELGIKEAKKLNLIHKGDLVVVLTGVLQRSPGKTNRLTIVNTN